MSIKERAKAQFAERATVELAIPEWGGSIFYRAPNLHVYKECIAESKGDQVEFNARLVVACAKDANGEPIWRKAEVVELMREYDPKIITYIASEITKTIALATTPADMAEAEKN